MAFYNINVSESFYICHIYINSMVIVAGHFSKWVTINTWNYITFLKPENKDLTLPVVPLGTSTLDLLQILLQI